MSQRKTEPVLHRAIRKKGVDALVQPKESISTANGEPVTIVNVDDGYGHARYRVERTVSRAFAHQLNRYLEKRPDIAFGHPRNHVRKILYGLPSFAQWSQFMPDSLALEPIYHPEKTHLVEGTRLNPLVRSLFRHGMDPVGVRTRTLTAGWIIKNHLASINSTEVKWLSFAGGTAVPAMIMLHACGIRPEHWQLTVLDLDEQASTIARELARSWGMADDQLRYFNLDVSDGAVIRQALPAGSYNAADMMGIFEYLDDDACAGLVDSALYALQPDGVIVFANMRAKHPQLALHQRGVGWPDVRPRTVSDVVAILEKSVHSAHLELEVFRPADAVYNVYKVTRKQT